MTKIAFIGLGIMGGPMAGHLVKAGYEVVGCNLLRPAVDHLIQQGGLGADSIAEAVVTADIVITMLPDSPDVEAAVLGKEGVYTHAKPGALYIDCSSIRPDVSKRVAEIGEQRGFRVLDAPVSGGQIGAVEATLSIMVGGDAGEFAKARPILEKVGRTVVHVGPNGAGQTVKAANQLIVAGNIELVAEAIVFLEAHGVDMESAIKVLAGGLAGSTVLDRKAANMLKRQFEPGFRLDLHHKDMGIVTAAAREVGVAIPLGSHVAQLVASLCAQGHGSLDHSALFMLVEQMSRHSSREEAR